MAEATCDAIDPDDLFAAAATVLGELNDLDLDARSAAEMDEAVVRFQELRARLDAAEARTIAR